MYYYDIRIFHNKFPYELLFLEKWTLLLRHYYLPFFYCLSNFTNYSKCFHSLSKISIHLLLNFDTKKLIEGNARNYTGLLSSEWPELSKSIVAHCKKLRSNEVKDFLAVHKNLIEAGM